MQYVPLFLVALLALVATAVVTAVIIPLLRKAAGQNIRAEGPQAHLSKAGTPSMGGIAIVVAILIASCTGGFFGHDTLIMDEGLLLFAFIGFMDDYLKIVKKENEGFKVKPKFALQFIGATVFALYIGNTAGTQVFIPFFKGFVDFGVFYYPFIIFTILAMVNAVNLTDGLDGLAAGTTAIVSAFMAILAVVYTFVPESGFYAAVCGACLGFLVFNHHPAKVFMGDTGSLALGGAVTIAAICMKMEFLLPIIGLVYVMEAFSVVLQVGYFKATHGKRIFRMAPLHHHFELGGMKETRVVLMFWSITFVCGLLGLLCSL